MEKRIAQKGDHILVHKSLSHAEVIAGHVYEVSNFDGGAWYNLTGIDQKWCCINPENYTILDDKSTPQDGDTIYCYNNFGLPDDIKFNTAYTISSVRETTFVIDSLKFTLSYVRKWFGILHRKSVTTAPVLKEEDDRSYITNPLNGLRLPHLARVSFKQYTRDYEATFWIEQDKNILKQAWLIGDLIGANDHPAEARQYGSTSWSLLEDSDWRSIVDLKVISKFPDTSAVKDPTPVLHRKNRSFVTTSKGTFFHLEKVSFGHSFGNQQHVGTLYISQDPSTDKNGEEQTWWFVSDTLPGADSHPKDARCFGKYGYIVFYGQPAVNQLSKYITPASVEPETPTISETKSLLNPKQSTQHGTGINSVTSTRQRKEGNSICIKVQGSAATISTRKRSSGSGVSGRRGRAAVASGYTCHQAISGY